MTIHLRILFSHRYRTVMEGRQADALLGLGENEVVRLDGTE
ncbi:MAG TPA: hypothetical protein VLA60_09975 [Nitrospirales bacterium]|nr:hypothetical protein [Nitrospirales bacterium]